MLVVEKIGAGDTDAVKLFFFLTAPISCVFRNARLAAASEQCSFSRGVELKCTVGPKFQTLTNLQANIDIY